MPKHDNPKGAEALIINASAPYCLHLLFYLTTRELDNFVFNDKGLDFFI